MTQDNGNNSGGGSAGVGGGLRLEPAHTLNFNFKVGGKLGGSFRIGPRTLIRGRNEAGKTQFNDAFELAWLGRHLIGQAGTKLVQLAPAGVREAYAELIAPTWSSKFVLHIHADGSAAKPQPPHRTGRAAQLTAQDIERALPHRAFPKLLDFGETLGREELIKRWGKVTEVPLPAGLSTAQREAWTAGEAAVRAAAMAEWEKKRAKAGAKADSVEGSGTLTPSEALAAMSAYFRREKGRLSGEAKDAAANLEKRRADLGAPGTAGTELIDDLRAKLERAEAWARSAPLRKAKADNDARAQRYTEAAKPLAERRSDEAKAAQKAAELAEDQALDEAIAVAAAALEAVRQEITAAGQAREERARVAFAHAYDERKAAAKAAANKERQLASDIEWAQNELKTAEVALAQERELLENGVVLLRFLEHGIAHAAEDGTSSCFVCANAAFVPAAVIDDARARVEARRASVNTAARAATDAEAALGAALAKRDGRVESMLQLQNEPVLDDALAAARAPTPDERERLNAAEAVVRAAHNKKAGVQRSRADADALEERAIEALRAERVHIVAAEAEINRGLAAFGALAPYDGPDVATLRARIETLSQTGHERTALEGLAGEVEALQAQHKLYQRLESVAEETLSDILRRTAASAEADVAAFTTGTYGFVVDLEAACWKAVSSHDGRAHARFAMTGAQDTELMLALAPAYAGADAPACFLLLDDRNTWGLDDVHFRRTLDKVAALQESGRVTQVLVSTWRTLNLPTEADGWLVHDMDDAAAASAMAAVPLPQPLVTPLGSLVDRL